MSRVIWLGHTREAVIAQIHSEGGLEDRNPGQMFGTQLIDLACGKALGNVCESVQHRIMSNMVQRDQSTRVSSGANETMLISKEWTCGSLSC